MNKQDYVNAIEIMLNLPANTLTSVAKCNNKDLKTMVDALIKMSDKHENPA